MTSPSSTSKLGEFQGTGILICASIFIAVQILVVGARLFTKYITRSVWGWDDYMLVPALVFATALDATLIYMAQYCGLGYHEIPLFLYDSQELILFVKLTLVVTTFIALAISFPRLSTCLIYLRIFTSRTLRTITWVVFGVNAMYCVMAIILTLTVCIPLSALWDPSLKGQCFDEKKWWGYGTVPVVLLDIITMALPVSTIMKLSVPLSERIALLLTFLVYGLYVSSCYLQGALFLQANGPSATIAEVVRIVIFVTRDATADVTWISVPLAYATMCEVGSCVIAACIPGLRPLYLYIAGKGSYSSRKGSKPGQSGQTPLHYGGSYQLNSHRTAPTLTSITTSERSKDGLYLSHSEESLTRKGIKVVHDVTVS